MSAKHAASIDEIEKSEVLNNEYERFLISIEEQKLHEKLFKDRVKKIKSAINKLKDIHYQNKEELKLLTEIDKTEFMHNYDPAFLAAIEALKRSIDKAKEDPKIKAILGQISGPPPAT